MTLSSVKPTTYTAQSAIWQVIKSLVLLPGVTLETSKYLIPDNGRRSIPDLDKIYIKNRHQSLPDYLLQWSESHQYYRVYIFVAGKDQPEKVNAGYPIMTIRNTLTVVGFINMLQFVHKNRSNNKTGIEE